MIFAMNLSPVNQAAAHGGTALSRWKSRAMGWSADWVRRVVSPASVRRDSTTREGSLNQALYVGFELIQRHRAGAKYRVVEGADIKLFSQRFLSHVA